ncbi:MAG: response regulator transcription factor [Tissierellia bacterium]|jgi:two-component system response regulator VicR|nr:response regulator transcription factor [Tissierellia bacterium]
MDNKLNNTIDILVADDENAIADIIKFNLIKQGYTIRIANDGEETLKEIEEKAPDLLVLDIMMPKKNGFEVLEILRKKYKFPVIILTAKEEESDKIHGLELGADDYMVKPFSINELIARVKANLRRLDFQNPENRIEEIKYEDIELDLGKYELKKRGETIELTVREFELLKYLAIRRGQVISREVLLNDVWGYEHFGDIRTVDVTVRRLREKIEDESGEPKYIKTKRGVGYYFGG